MIFQRAVFVLLAAAVLAIPPPLDAGESNPPEGGEASPAPSAEKAAPAAPGPAPPLSRLIAFALGWQAPLGSPGKSVPIWAVLAWGDGLLGENTRLRVTVQTTNITGLLEVPIDRTFFAGVRANGVIVSGQCAPYRYLEGERLKDLEINSTCFGGSLFAGVKVSEMLNIRIFAEAHDVNYQRNEETGPGLVKPPDHLEGCFGVEGSLDNTKKYQDWQITTGWSSTFRAEYFMRDHWRQWGPPSEPQTRPGAHRQGARLSTTDSVGLRLFGHHNLILSADAGLAWDVDVLSAFHAGSLVGSPSLPGYYYGEIVCDRYFFLEARYGANLWEGARGWAGLRGGGYREIDGGPYMGTFSIVLSLTQKIFFGIPLTVQYGFSPTADRKSLGGGHEISVVMVGAKVFGEGGGE